MIGLLLILEIILHTTLASYVSHPNINLDLLGISGSYNGISLYTDTNQLTQIPSSTSSVISFSNDTLFQLLASSNLNGTIHDSCILYNSIYIAGNFSTINGIHANHIAALDIHTGQLDTLAQGLDGPVSTVYCDAETKSVFVGGSFTAPVNTNQLSYSASLAQFGGSIAVWNGKQWAAVPWKGVNGPVHTILRYKQSMLFAGSFDTTMDGQTSYAPASQIIPLPKTGATASNSASTTDTASSIVCATSTNSNVWMLKDGQTGTWQTTFGYYSVNPSLVRIANSRLTNHQTKEFGVRPIDNATYFQMAYLDPASNTTKTCTTNCVLSNDASVEYQDFRILNTTMTSGIAIDVKSWYGSSGGLASVSVFQSENFIYAIDTSAEDTPCGNNTLKRIETKGSWTRINDGDLAYYASNATNDSSIIFYPGLAESGNYDVYIYLPQCSGTSCNDRVNLDVHIYTSPGQNATVEYVDASSNAQDGLFLSSAYFNLSLDFQPTIEITAAHNETKTGSIIAHAFQFVKNPSRGALSNIIQYNTTAELQWGPLSTELASNSIVNDIKEYQDSLYIVGSFKGTDSSNGVYNNIVQYNSGKLKALKSGGTNGPIESIAIAPQTGEIFVAGNFSALASSNATQISSVGRYNVNQATWNPLEGGIQGVAHKVSLINGHILVSGEIEKISSISAFGVGWWNIGKAAWDYDMPFLSGTVYCTLEYDNKYYFSGSIHAAQRYQSFGSSVFNATVLSQLPFYPLDQQPVVTAGAVINSTIILGGQFTLPGNIKNIALYQNSSWRGVEGSDWKGTIYSMVAHQDTLYVGGESLGGAGKAFAAFGLTNGSLMLSPNITTSDGSNASVSVVRPVSAQNAIIVGGHFSLVGELGCSTVCALDTRNHQWLPLGSGLAGQVTDIEYIDGKLVVTGNMTLNNSPITIAEYDFEKQVWGPFATANLPGPSVAMTYDNVTKHTFISGKDSTNGSTYLRVWNGQQFNPIDQGLGSGSVISKMYSLPVKDTTQNTLLATGLINLGSLGNVSAAFFDGQQWTPYLVTSSASADGFLRSLFYFDIPSIPSTIRRFLPAPLVILVSIAISLGIVFFIVLATMCIIFFKRKAESKIDPQNAPEAYYSKPPRSADSVLAALKDENNNNPNYSAEKLDTLEPEAQIYSMSRSISTDYLHEQPPTPAMMKPTALSPAPPKLPYNMSTNSFYQGLTPSPRPDSFVRPMSDIRRDSQPSSMTVREMSEVDGDRRGSYNPFRRPSSELL
ncbi:hypothetical protein G6F70_006527 [Rhizopus microsporus]|uniref:Uncharacterized protein n=1 Tax=Rhizopus microsporus TaxID=58291 RepID=A0A1X0RNK3_RHIZD|nr:hypothetical protein G6F71_006427 [Rhizopus microsporus]KAG1197553.1 hypothetical protein G6F70_006527 [Rhizopus microsporus]KAG1209340.1 hypothetical protein G6F69_006440 [Rhizopus microsporus]KAG1230787.1 hypothetical protein G6F67_006213 [Rhizopus microsporus]KAG1263067.1 hypothetical protein G6F68_005444 [Rhizopus microsporus]